MEQSKRSCLTTFSGSFGSIVSFYLIIHLANYTFTVLFLDAPGKVMKKGDAEKVIGQINEKISRFDQKIVTYEYGLTNDQFLVFYSTAKTSMSKMQNMYNEAELDFFKLVLTKITANDELFIAPRDALNLITQITGSKLNKLKAQKLMDNWIQSNYFYQHSDNKIYLGAKILCEFKELLQNMELDYLKSCLLCENVAVWVRVSCFAIYHGLIDVFYLPPG